MRELRYAVLMFVGVGWLLAACGGESDGSTTAGAGEPQASTTLPTTVPPTTEPTCPESGLQVTVGGSDAAMGLRVMGLRLSNCGTETTTVAGYPDLTLLDEDRQEFTVDVVHGPGDITSSGNFCDAGPQAVDLAPGEEAVSGLVWRNQTTDELDQLVNAPFLSVAPLEGGVPQELVPDDAIDLGTTGELGVSAWRPADSGCSARSLWG